jgi:hypothetical protein
MNIFVLDESPVIAAQMHCNKHIVKMILETAQLLSTALRFYGVNYGYNITHKNHPCSVWARATKGNFIWLNMLGRNLLEEYKYRYGKEHKSTPIISEAPIGCIPDGPQTQFVQCMPDIYKAENAVQAYRNYYRGAKKHLLIYTKRMPPNWVSDIARYKPL